MIPLRVIEFRYSIEVPFVQKKNINFYHYRTPCNDSGEVN